MSAAPPAGGRRDPGEHGPDDRSGLAATVLDAAAPWWDPDHALLWNMAGSFTELCPPRTVHLIPPSAWFALGLLHRDGPDDRARAEATLDALLAHQYHEPGTAWHGTYARFAEWPHPEPDALAWEGYDPNWRQFLGVAFALVLDVAADRLDPALVRRLEGSILLAVESEGDERVRPAYTNIALMKAWLDGWAGARFERPDLAAGGERLAADVVGRFARHGTFDEYQSPTYYGVDLLALALWRTRSPSALVREAGARLEAALWDDLADLYHPGLRNLCGPWDRAYGMDLADYVGAMALWWWPAVGRAATPLPDLGEPFEHAHDLVLGAPVELLGPAVPHGAEAALTSFRGEHEAVRQVGRRRITAWLHEEVMLGGATGSTAPARDQHHPATAHWRTPGGGVGWLRAVHGGVVSAAATPGVLALTCEPAADGTTPVVEVGGPAADEVTLRNGTLHLPGLALDLHASALFSGLRSEGGTARLRLEQPPGEVVDLRMEVVGTG